MEAPRLERKLVAILAADIEGYSRYMSQDEVSTLEVLSSHQAIVDELVVSHNGRITGTAGDSFLAEFTSIIDALDCAIKIQGTIEDRLATEPSHRQLRYRIGLNVGDVMVKNGDIFGDGVNVAARLETLAQPGGICVSRGVRDHVRHNAQFSFDDLGEQKVKNIEQPIRAFRVLLDDADRDAPVTGATTEIRLAQDAAEGHGRTANDAAFEISFWDSIKESTDPSEFEAYLEKYPEGEFSALAKSRLAIAEEPHDEAISSTDAVAVELAFWDTVKESGSPAMFGAYLAQYPDGAFAVLAKVMLAETSGST
ncbi:class 3 adenylate cyclase [Rhodoligotrophos appendicifer]|uniref:adenylate/guanylate cyclase domain-containing protein n=1 Tax=Rhodoligotrophos appendicifer TaxID=987056 RepID=UPI001185FE9C|nr:adenylate/guanylate cyclase domain-containing protein [Rhodoligotrophos appendicifer]